MDLWEYGARLAYIASSRPGKATYLNLFLKINNKERKKKNWGSWKDGSAVKNTYCSSGGPELSS